MWTFAFFITKNNFINPTNGPRSYFNLESLLSYKDFWISYQCYNAGKRALPLAVSWKKYDIKYITENFQALWQEGTAGTMGAAQQRLLAHCAM